MCGICTSSFRIEWERERIIGCVTRGRVCGAALRAGLSLGRVELFNSNPNKKQSHTFTLHLNKCCRHCTHCAALSQPCDRGASHNSNARARTMAKRAMAGRRVLCFFRAIVAHAATTSVFFFLKRRGSFNAGVAWCVCRIMQSATHATQHAGSETRVETDQKVEFCCVHQITRAHTPLFYSHIKKASM